jgi:hypothetical protein
MRQLTIVQVGTSLDAVFIRPGRWSFVVVVESENERSSEGGRPADRCQSNESDENRSYHRI